MSDKKEKKTFTMDEVKKHDNSGSCWIVVHGEVYDCTTFLFDHPGGDDIILRNCGGDCSEVFEQVLHSPEAHNMLEGYHIGSIEGWEGQARRKNIEWETLDNVIKTGDDWVTVQRMIDERSVDINKMPIISELDLRKPDELMFFVVFQFIFAALSSGGSIPFYAAAIIGGSIAINRRLPSIRSPLMYAMMYNRKRIVDVLIGSGADIKSKQLAFTGSFEPAQTPLENAVKKRDVCFVRALLAAGCGLGDVNPDQPSSREITLLLKEEERKERQRLEEERQRLEEERKTREADERERAKMLRLLKGEISTLSRAIKKLQNQHKDRVQRLQGVRRRALRDEGQYDLSSPVIPQLVSKAMVVSRELAHATDSESKDSETNSDEKRTLLLKIRRHKSLHGVIAEADAYLNHVNHVSVLSVDSVFAEGKKLSQIRAKLYECCAELDKRQRSSVKLRSLVDQRGSAFTSLQKTIGAVEASLSRARGVVKQGVQLLNKLRDKYSLGSVRNVRRQSSENGAGVFEVPDFRRLPNRIKKAYIAYKKRRASLLSDIEAQPDLSEIDVLDDVNRMEQCNAAYRKAVDNLTDVCERSVEMAQRLSDDLDRHSRCARPNLAARCYKLRQALIVVSKAVGKAEESLTSVKPAISHLGSLLQLKADTVTEDAVREYEAKFERIYAMRETLLSLKFRIKMRQDDGMNADSLLEERDRVLRKFQELRSDNDYQIFRSTVRRLMRDFPELRVQFPKLVATAVSIVATVGYNMFRVDADSDVYKGNHQVVQAEIIGEGSLDTLGVDKGSVVALKELRAGIGSGVLKSVVKGLSQLQHQSVISLLGVSERYDSKECVQRTNLVFPWYKRGDMRKWLHAQRESKWLPTRSQKSESKQDSTSKLSLTERRERAVVQCLRPALQGLAYLHSRGVLHCDLKPENILLDGNGQGILCDLDGFQVAAVTGGQLGGSEAKGLTHRITKKITLGVTSLQRMEFGTDGYRDPSLKEFTASSDVYAMGIILAECLLGWDALEYGDSQNDHNALRVAIATGTGVAEGVDESTRKLLSAMIRLDESKRASVKDVLEHPFFKGRPVLRSCAVCWDEDIQVHQGLQCVRGHFTCGTCLGEHVRSYAKKLVSDDGASQHVPCATCDCSFADFEILENLSNKDALTALWKARSQRTKTTVTLEVESKYRAELERWKRQSELERLAEERRHAQKQIEVLEGIREMLIREEGGTRGGFGQRLKRCPNGHYYVVGNCGGAMQLGNCVDCGAPIGGGQHRNAAGCDDLDLDQELGRWRAKLRDCQAKERVARSTSRPRRAD